MTAPVTPRRAVVFVHGVTTTRRGAERGIGLYRAPFEQAGYHTDMYIWGWRFIGPIFLPWLRLKPRARALTALCDQLSREYDTVDILAHSYGCTVSALATAMGAPVRALVFLNAAADRSTLVIGKQVRLVINYYEPRDPYLRIARVVPFNPTLGDVGRRPLTIEGDHRIWSANLREQYGITSHGGALRWENTSRLGPAIVRAIAIHAP